MFLVYTPDTIIFNPDSGSTDILIRRQDSHALQNLHYFTATDPAPAFYVANNTIIYPYAIGTLHPPNTTLTLQAYAFNNEDLADNLFGLAPLLNQGCIATFTSQSCSITGPSNEGHQLIFYGTKPPYANAWKFSLPRPSRCTANTIVRHETHAEIALYASAVFGNPTFKTLAAALRKQWLSNYPDLTLKMLNANKPHSPATGLGHITASRANVRSTRTKKTVQRRPTTYLPTPAFLTQPAPTALSDGDSDSDSDSDSALDEPTPTRALHGKRRTTHKQFHTPAPLTHPIIPITYTIKDTTTPLTNAALAPMENLYHYPHHDRPDIVLRAKVLHTSEFRNHALFSDPTGRFPVTAKDGSQYLLVSVYKKYIHVETMPSRTTSALLQAYTTTHRWFRNHGHHLKIQILDNENPRALQDHFDTLQIKWQMVTPFKKRTNKAERAIQTFKRHFLSILSSTHPSFPLNHWPELLEQTEYTLNMLRPWADQPSISAYHGIFREPYNFLAHPMAPLGTLIVVHDTQRETWDNFGQVGYYLGPSYHHYRNYRCLITETDSIRTSDNIILYPAPLVLPGASRFDKLLALTEELTQLSIRPSAPTDPDSQELHRDCLQRLKKFLTADTPNNPTTPAEPITCSTRHKPTSDLGLDLIGHSFPDKSLGTCCVVGTDTYLDEDGIIWHLLQYTSSRKPDDDPLVSKVSEVRGWLKRKGSTSPSHPPTRTAPPFTLRHEVPDPLKQAPEALAPFRSILHAPKTHKPTSPYNLRTRRAMNAKIRAPATTSTAAPEPAAHNVPPPLNLDLAGNPLTYQSAMAGPDKSQWEIAGGDEITRLIESLTAIPIHKTKSRATNGATSYTTTQWHAKS